MMSISCNINVLHLIRFFLSIHLINTSLNIQIIMFKTALLASLLASASAFAPSQYGGRLDFDDTCVSTGFRTNS